VTRDEIVKLVAWLRERVTLSVDGRVDFDEPDEEAMAGAGFGPEVAAKTLRAPWWPDMIADIVETPDCAGPDCGPDLLLQYARDVVHEYIAKRLA
jgi:hypothetical protein